ncbi:MAG: SUMF1/EgtB/PvdO family nonheme iron enzyme, partial [Kiritimatiellia bacterium]
GGPVVPFLVDAEWNAPAAAGSRARRLGAVAGQLWGLGGYVMHCTQSYNIPHACSIGLAGTLNDDFPTGYEAFYCMKHQVTQGQYVEFLNSLPQETAARLATVPDGEFVPQTNSLYPWEGMGLTITDPGRIKIGTPKKKDKPTESGEDQFEPGGAADMLLEEPKKKEQVVARRPIYTARLPNRTCNYLHWQDGYAFAVWAGLRPMTELEFEKACRGPLNPVPGEHAWGSANAITGTNWINGDLPTERCQQGNYHGMESGRLWNERATRAGIFATPESDRFQAGATYWGILDMDIATFAMSAASINDRVFDVLGVSTNLRPFRGSHGDGCAPAARASDVSQPPDWIPPGGRTGMPVSQRSVANIASERPPTYPRTGDGRSNRATWRGVRSAAIGKRSTAALAPAQPGTAGEPTGTRTNTADWDIVHDSIKVENVKCEAGSAQYSTVTCDIAWENSWRAKWTEPAEKNVTGKPLQVESWDAAWVFVKFRTPGDKTFSHAMLSSVDSEHKAPAGAALSVGLCDDGSAGLGVFVYRAADGVGANAFKGLKLRWVLTPSVAGAASPARFDPAKAEVKVYAIPMVYVPGGPFQTKGPWGHPLTLISTGDATQPGGHRLEPAPLVSDCWGEETDADQTKKRRQVGAVPKSDSWPNGYRAFYCTKYSITQGQYVDFLNDQGGSPWPIYKFNRYTIRLLEDKKRFAADVPDRLCNQMSCGEIFAYTAWAGLRPLTDMEYEKACRGPRAVARAEDAWNAAACVRADGLSKVNMAAGSPAASYWGIRELSFTGIPFEWPLTFHNELGLVFKGTHGNGDSKGREDWLEIGDTGETYEDRLGWGTQLGIWIDPSHVGFIPIGHITGPFGDRTGRYGVHIGMTA